MLCIRRSGFRISAAIYISVLAILIGVLSFFELRIQKCTGKIVIMPLTIMTRITFIHNWTYCTVGLNNWHDFSANYHGCANYRGSTVMSKSSFVRALAMREDIIFRFEIKITHLRKRLPKITVICAIAPISIIS